MRLDKFLADAGLGTRSEIKSAIRKKNVTVNETIICDPGYHITTEDHICFNHSPVRSGGAKYFMMHKPMGCVCANKDSGKTVFDLMKPEDAHRLFTVGRLDKDTEGLLFLTDDGAFAHQLTSPRKHVKKTYYFEGDGIFLPDAATQIEKGLDIGDDKPTAPAQLIVHMQDMLTERTSGELTIHEGRYHQVKRMLARVGVTVTYLKRLSIGSVRLDPALAPGQYRRLTEEEIHEFIFADIP